MPDLVRRVVRSRHQRVLVLPVRLPGAWGRAIRRGDALLAEGVTGRGPAFGDWLRDHPSGWEAADAAPDQGVRT
jgi:hypothetical protein